MTEIIKLKYPVTVDGVEYDQLEMRRCKVRDRRLAAKKGDAAEQETTLIANLCNVPPNVIDELDSTDYAQLSEVLRGFLGLPSMI